MNEGLQAPATFACPQDPADVPVVVALKPFATVRVSSHIQAQGPLLDKLPDGRIVVQCGGAVVIGDRI